MIDASSSVSFGASLFRGDIPSALIKSRFKVCHVVENANGQFVQSRLFGAVLVEGMWCAEFAI